MQTNNVAVVSVNQVGLESVTSIELRSASGKIAGTRYVYSGNKSARELDADFKANGLKGKERKEAVRAALSGTRDYRWLVKNAVDRKLEQDGYVPDTTDMRKNGAVTRFSRVGARPTAETAKAVINSMTPAERLELLKELGVSVAVDKQEAKTLDVASEVVAA